MSCLGFLGSGTAFEVVCVCVCLCVCAAILVKVAASSVFVWAHLRLAVLHVESPLPLFPLFDPALTLPAPPSPCARPTSALSDGPEPRRRTSAASIPSQLVPLISPTARHDSSPAAPAAPPRIVIAVGQWRRGREKGRGRGREKGEKRKELRLFCGLNEPFQGQKRSTGPLVHAPLCLYSTEIRCTIPVYC